MRRTAASSLAAMTLVVVSSCGGNDTTGTSHTDAHTTTSAPTEDTSDVTASADPTHAAQALLATWAAVADGGGVVALASTDAPPIIASAGVAGPDGRPMTADAEFRIGSLTKTFVAVLVLQLVDDGVLGLDDLVTEHAPHLTIADGVTVRQLLAHRSGIPEHTDGELGPAIVADPARTWTAAEVLRLVADQPRDFDPGTTFAYSNSNYLVAGLLLEHLTGNSLAEQLDVRIVEPLDLRATYLAPDAQRSPIGGFSRMLPGGDTDGASYHALETAAGTAGAMVSTAADLAVFIRALGDGQLLSPGSFGDMTAGIPAHGDSLGVFPADPPTATGISNGGAIPGFASFMQYDPASGDMIVLLLNDDTTPADTLGTSLLELAAEL